MQNTTTTLTLRRPSDAVSIVPYLLGFHPANSLVLIGTGGPHGTFAVRLDLPPEKTEERENTEETEDTTEEEATEYDGTEALIDHLTDIVAGRECAAVIVVGYGPEARVAPVVDLAIRHLEKRGLDLLDAFRVHGDRFWSYICDEPECCSPDGTPFDVGTSEVAAQATACGMVALADRAELERIVEPVGGAEMAEATKDAEERLRPDTTVADGLALVRALLDKALQGDDPPSNEEVAELGIVLTHLRVRDEAWIRVDDDHLDVHVAFWADVVRRVTETYVAGPASLLAFAAWRTGNGALANVALARALAVDARYSMARLLHELFISGMSPAAFAIRMTSEQLDDAWEGCEE